MKLLLTSGGLANRSIINALEELVVKPFSELKIVFIPTAANIEEDKSYIEEDLNSLKQLGFKDIKEFDIANKSLGKIEKIFNDSDIIWFTGGNTFYLLDQLKKTKLDKNINKFLTNKIYVGVSAGSIVATPNILTAFIEPSDINSVNLKNFNGLNLVNFEISPHTNSYVPFENVIKYSQKSKNTVYSIDDNSAIKIDGDKLEVISEGSWKKFEK